MESIVNPIEKKSGAEECVEFRTINLVSHTSKVLVCFIDYEKAFDRVNWIKMMEILNDNDVDWRNRKLIMNLYKKQSAFVRIGES